MIDLISQIMVMIVSPFAIWLVGRKEVWRRWGYFAGLLGQPFWFMSFISNEQWGMVIATCFYTYGWLQGIWNFWISEDTKYMLKNFLYYVAGKNICPQCGGAGIYFSEGMARNHLINKGHKCDICKGKGRI